jgi:hypothetical protein
VSVTGLGELVISRLPRGPGSQSLPGLDRITLRVTRGTACASPSIHPWRSARAARATRVTGRTGGFTRMLCGYRAILPDASSRLRDHQFNVVRGELRDDPDQAPVHHRIFEEREKRPTAEAAPGSSRGRWRVVRTNDPALPLKSHRQLVIKHTRDWTEAVLIRPILRILKPKPLPGGLR